MAEVEEKIFHHFLKFSPKVRMMVTNEMEPADRCRLTRCSKLCDKEAKASKNYIYGLDLDYNTNGIMIIVSHGTRGPIQNTGYIMTFNSATKLKTYTNRSYQTMWETEVDSGQLAFEEFKSIVQKYQRNIRKLRLNVDLPGGYTEKRRFIDFGIESLDSLEHLTVRRDVDFQNLFSKLQKPLKNLYIFGYENSGIIDYESIYQVQKDLIWYRGKFNNQQFLQLSAKNVAISIEKLTERDIFHFIRSWQDGTIGKAIEHYAWSRDNSNFNIHQLLKLLRIRDYDRQREILEIKHFKDDGKIAKLFIYERAISFVVPQIRH